MMPPGPWEGEGGGEGGRDENYWAQPRAGAIPNLEGHSGVAVTPQIMDHVLRRKDASVHPSI